MRITKDEARVLSCALDLAKYQIIEDRFSTKEEANKAITALDKFQSRLEWFERDERRFGRTSQNNFSDCLKRFIKRNNQFNK